jgi:DNA-binding MarR family transcriptional regulator/N-acetylglutamate synthase-like GNAT family acetyltransferase
MPTSASHVDEVRRFNRFYTRQIGVLREKLYSSPFSLTEVRVLYELANREQLTATDLGKDLGLDRGYLSRMLRGFEQRGWINRTASRHDARQNFLKLTAKGRSAFAPLNARSEQEVTSQLREISPSQQHHLVRAMQTIERLLGSSPEPPADREAFILRALRPGDLGWVVHRHGVLYSQEYNYDERFEALVAKIAGEFVEHHDRRRERCWIAEHNGEVLGCVFLVKQSKTVAKLRMLLVEPAARGRGIGRRLVAECVEFARQAGYKTITLWTQSELKAARGIYESAGFRLVEQHRHDSWSRKGLVSETWERNLQDGKPTNT